MTRRKVGLRTLGALIVSISSVMATPNASALTARSIIITGGYTPVGTDPPYDYIFNVTLESGSIANGATITIDDLLGVTPPNTDTSSPLILSPLGSNAIYSAPSNELGNSAFNFGVLNNPEGIVLETSNAANPLLDTSDVTYTYLGPGLTVTSGPIFLGQFAIETNVNYSSGPPYQPGDTVTYTSSVPAGSGTIVLQNLAVPEPSSAVLLLLGAGALPAVMWHRRRRQSQPLMAAID
jgi:PEP-CTERM motif